MVTSLASPESALWAGGLETQGKATLQFESEGCLLAESREFRLLYCLDGARPHYEGQSALFKIH